MRTITNIFVSLFYTGYIKFIPGTFGTIISIIILYPILKFNLVSTNLFICLFLVIFIFSLFFINKFSNYSNSHDSSIIVIDEFLGIYLIFIFYDFIYFLNDFFTIALIFIFFRFFDILKVFPANIIDRKIQNSLGVLLDDLVASIYTIIVLILLNVYLY